MKINSWQKNKKKKNSKNPEKFTKFCTVKKNNFLHNFIANYIIYYSWRKKKEKIKQFRSHFQKKKRKRIVHYTQKAVFMKLFDEEKKKKKGIKKKRRRKLNVLLFFSCFTVNDLQNIHDTIRVFWIHLDAMFS